MHHSKTIWGDPENFRPSRFLSSGSENVTRNESLVIFSSGKRACLGESLAKNELFLFTTSILQRFNVHVDPNSSDGFTVDCWKGQIVTLPKSRNLVFENRNK